MVIHSVHPHLCNQAHFCSPEDKEDISCGKLKFTTWHYWMLIILSRYLSIFWIIIPSTTLLYQSLWWAFWVRSPAIIVFIYLFIYFPFPFSIALLLSSVPLCRELFKGLKVQQQTPQVKVWILFCVLQIAGKSLRLHLIINNCNK